MAHDASSMLPGPVASKTSDASANTARMAVTPLGTPRNKTRQNRMMGSSMRCQLLMVVTIASNAASRASGEAGDSRMSFRRGRPQCATASARSPASVLLQFVPKRACGCSSCDAGCRGISRSQASALPARATARARTRLWWPWPCQCHRTHQMALACKCNGKRAGTSL